MISDDLDSIIRAIPIEKKRNLGRHPAWLCPGPACNCWTLSIAEPQQIIAVGRIKWLKIIYPLVMTNIAMV
jgi:hypothetical protein